jgi:hypothetical protein
MDNNSAAQVSIPKQLVANYLGTLTWHWGEQSQICPQQDTIFPLEWFSEGIYQMAAHNEAGFLELGLRALLQNPIDRLDQFAQTEWEWSDKAILILVEGALRVWFPEEDDKIQSLLSIVTWNNLSVDEWNKTKKYPILELFPQLDKR